jgi:TetR/AcrR family transcriptional regulator, tetracycline repressor protein
MQASQKSKVAPSRRGRPPRLSREEIATVVAEMLRGDPVAPLTMARAAEAIGASPMSLYRHFADRDDLVVEVIRHVMSEAHVGAPADAPWPERVRAWMVAVYGQVAAHPQLFQGSAFGASPAWLPDTAYLASVLDSAGFPDERQRAEAVYLIATTTLGHALMAATLGRELSLPPLYAGLSYLKPEEVESAAALLPHLVAISKDGFALVADLTVAALERRVS